MTKQKITKRFTTPYAPLDEAAVRGLMLRLGVSEDDAREMLALDQGWTDAPLNGQPHPKDAVRKILKPSKGSRVTAASND